MAELASLCRHVGRRWAEFAQRLTNDLDGTGYCQYGHDGRYDNVRPTCAGAEYARCGSQDSKVGDSVVARTNPYGLAVGIAIAVVIQQKSASEVRRESQCADHPHYLGLGNGLVDRIPSRLSGHPDSQDSQ